MLEAHSSHTMLQAPLTLSVMTETWLQPCSSPTAWPLCLWQGHLAQRGGRGHTAACGVWGGVRPWCSCAGLVGCSCPSCPLSPCQVCICGCCSWRTAFLSEASLVPKFSMVADEPEKFTSLKGLATFLLASKGQR